ncbi:hypothetical protein [Alloalcanivorax xenomutans]|uniref:hypothetical protein n=1 Tax=Alloalcanivorax xenomutans TaxID=1094342 RepID=UPI0024E1DC26|nr:hypothetical protein [Alloalcanivorax xenomutans]
MTRSRKELGASPGQQRSIWEQSLERARRHPDYGLADFLALLKEEKKKKTFAALPPLDVALWPEDALKPNDLDIENPRLFNERYIELPTVETVGRDGKLHWLPRLFLLFHNLALLLFLGLYVAAFVDEKLDAWSAIGLFAGYLCAGGIPFLFFYFLSPFSPMMRHAEKKGSARYNRQAQLVHISCGGDKVLHVPWRHVRALVEFSVMSGSLGGTGLVLTAPRPWVLDELDRFSPRGKPQKELFSLPYGFWTGGDRSIPGILRRWEFIRRYMEKGLEAIQPDPDLKKGGLLYSPGAEPTSTRELGHVYALVFHPLERLGYFLTFGAWLDRQAAVAEEALDGFEWPEEVEELCAPSADVAAFNHQPIPARTDIYYRFAGFNGYEYVDSRGQPASGRHGIDELMAEAKEWPSGKAKPVKDDWEGAG